MITLLRSLLPIKSLASVALLAACAGSPPSKSTQQTRAPVETLVYHSLSVSSQALTGSVSLNGIPLEILDEDGFSMSTQVQHWSRDGKNVITIAIDTAREDANLNVELLSKSEETGEEAKLLEASWPSDESSEAPTTLSFEVDLGVAPSTLWRVAEPIRLDDKARGELHELAKRLHTAFHAADADALAEMMTFKTQELARAMGMTLEEAEASHREMLTMALAKKPDTVFSGVELDLQGDGHVILLNGKDGDYLLTTEDDETTFAIPVYVARIAGHWHVVR